MSESTVSALHIPAESETGLPVASEQLPPIDPAVEAGITPERLSRVGRLLQATKRSGHMALRSSQVSLALLELSPANEMITAGAGLTAQGVTHNPITTGLVYGIASWGMESLGAVSAAPLLGTERSQKFTNWLNEKIASRRKDEDPLVLSKGTKIIAATYGGSVLAMALETREDPNRTVAQNRRFGLWTSLWLGGVCAVEGALFSEGINLSWDNPKVAVPALAAGAAGYVGNRLRKRHNNKQTDSSEAQPENVVEAAPIRYDLTPEELQELEQGLVSLAKENSPNEGIVGVWISPKSKFANVVRIHEASYFPEVQEITEEDEINTLFLALVDTRADVNRVVHGATITGMSYDSNEKQMYPKRDTDKDSTGFYTVDSLIELGNFSAEEFQNYYAAKGIRPDKCIAVETNFRIGDKSGKFNGFSPTDIAYLMFFNLLEQTGVKTGEGGVLATINKASIDSFKRVGLEYEPLMGRQDLVTEESLLGKESLPVLLPYTQTNQTLFGIMRDAGADVPALFA